MRCVVISGCALLAACSPPLRTVEEPAGADLRVLALFPAASAPAITVRVGDAPLRLELAEDFEGELWSFHYLLPSLAADYPSLRGRSAADVAALLTPSFVARGLRPPETPSAPLRALRTVVSASDDAAYREVAWSQWLHDSARPPLQPFAFAITRGGASCARIRVDRWAGPPGVSFDAVASLSDDRAIAIGARSNDQPSVVLRLSRTGTAALPTPPDLVGRVRSLASAGDDLLYGLADAPLPSGGRMFAIDATAAHHAVPVLSGSGERAMVRAGADGLVIASFAEGVFETTRGATVATRRADFVQTPQLLQVVARERMAAVDARGLVVRDRGAWTLEHDFGFVELPFGLGGDAELLVLTGEHGLVLLRDEVARTWTALPELPVSPRLLPAVTPLGHGRLLIVGSPGFAAVWMGADWCVLDTGTTGLFTAASSLPGSAVAWAVSIADPARPSERAQILRVEVTD